ncbi:hypothetical protein O6P43_021778 [Quillaja saponaria]|uniref:Uncharacterized protein n=1 Tax=Quillaja saponaria TaxID=32244 RepID=A0AAD7PHN4_QUISA|nr:hypothetical protein O6P43_021778 [Quillaja saponaria]
MCPNFNLSTLPSQVVMACNPSGGLRMMEQSRGPCGWVGNAQCLLAHSKCRAGLCDLGEGLDHLASKEEGTA